MWNKFKKYLTSCYGPTVEESPDKGFKVVSGPGWAYIIYHEAE